VFTARGGLPGTYFDPRDFKRNFFRPGVQVRAYLV